MDRVGLLALAANLAVRRMAADSLMGGGGLNVRVCLVMSLAGAGGEAGQNRFCILASRCVKRVVAPWSGAQLGPGSLWGARVA